MHQHVTTQHTTSLLTIKPASSSPPVHHLSNNTSRYIDSERNGGSVSMKEESSHVVLAAASVTARCHRPSSIIPSLHFHVQAHAAQHSLDRRQNNRSRVLSNHVLLTSPQPGHSAAAAASLLHPPCLYQSIHHCPTVTALPIPHLPQLTTPPPAHPAPAHATAKSPSTTITTNTHSSTHPPQPTLTPHPAPSPHPPPQPARVTWPASLRQCWP